MLSSSVFKSKIIGRFNMSKPSNPFVYDRALDPHGSELDEQVYIPYEIDIINLLDKLKSKPYDYFVSPPKSGTTTFFNVLSTYIKANSLPYVPIKIDLINILEIIMFFLIGQIPGWLISIFVYVIFG